VAEGDASQTPQTKTAQIANPDEKMMMKNVTSFSNPSGEVVGCFFVVFYL